MDYNQIINNLQYLSVSRLTAVSKLYNIDCSTSNVYRLNKALERVVEEGKRVEVKTTVAVDHDEVIDMQSSVALAVEMYKIKYNRSSFPRDMNIYQLIDDFNKLNPAQIIRDVLTPSKKKEETKPTKKRLSKQEKEDLEYEEFLKKKKLEILSKQ
nr:hypothetical protein [uncultured Sphingobacterium sp.]